MGTPSRDRVRATGVPGTPSRPAGHLVELEALHRFTVHLEDPVARHDAGLLAGGVGKDLGHDDKAVLVLDEEADATVGVTKAFTGEAGELLRGEEGRVGVVDLADEPAGSPLIDLVLGDRVDGLPLQPCHNLVQQSGPIALRRTSGEQRHRGQGYDRNHQ